jgi:transposase
VAQGAKSRIGGDGEHRVYWIAPHEVLEAEGLEVMLVDTRQLARVPGRDKKSDPSDCEWIQRLHSCGLLMGSFRPKEAVCMLRTLVRDKGNLVAEVGDWLRRMQKNLDQMNVRVHRAVSDIDGVTGMAILRAIVAGERDARKLAKLRDAALPQERGGDRGAIERALAGGSLIQPGAGIEDVRQHPGADHRL